MFTGMEKNGVYSYFDRHIAATKTISVAYVRLNINTKKKIILQNSMVYNWKINTIYANYISVP